MSERKTKHTRALQPLARAGGPCDSRALPVCGPGSLQVDGSDWYRKADTFIIYDNHSCCFRENEHLST